MIALKITEHQATILENKLSRTLIHLENDKLTDSDCYVNLKPMLFNLRQAIESCKQQASSDLESELGISLELLNKLRHSKQVFIKDDNGNIVVGYIDSINIRKYMFVGRYKGISDIKKGFRINFRAYGSKIALTETELRQVS